MGGAGVAAGAAELPMSKPSLSPAASTTAAVASNKGRKLATATTKKSNTVRLSRGKEPPKRAGGKFSKATKSSEPSPRKSRKSQKKALSKRKKAPDNDDDESKPLAKKAKKAAKLSSNSQKKNGEVANNSDYENEESDAKPGCAACMKALEGRKVNVAHHKDCSRSRKNKQPKRPRPKCTVDGCTNNAKRGNVCIKQLSTHVWFCMHPSCLHAY